MPLDIEIDGEYVICPKCGEKAGDCWEWVREETSDYVCGGCGAKLKVWAEYDVSYYCSYGDEDEPPAP